jgi:hypothetical protein
MKSLKILIFSCMLLCVVFPPSARGQALAIGLGVYDFTDITAREFYLMAPAFTLGGNVWKESRIALHLSGGLAFNSMKYDDHRHYLYMVPLFLTLNYELPNPGSKVWPVIGGGFSLNGKADRNQSLDKTHYSLTYGFHLRGRLNVLLKNNYVIYLEGGYNFLVPPANEELDMSGFLTTLGLSIPLSQSPK